jgi:hypothetical protein
MDMITDRPRHADATRRAFGLEPRRDVDCVAVKIGSIWNGVAKVDPDPKADSPIRRLVAIMDGHLLLHLHGTSHRPIDAVEHDEQRVTAGLRDPAAVFLDRWINQISSQCP